MRLHITVELTSLSSAHCARVTVRDDSTCILNVRTFSSNADAWRYVEQYTVNAHNKTFRLDTIG